MTVRRMDHLSVIVDDFEAAVGFFTALGLEPEGRAVVEGDWVDRVVGLDGIRSDVAMLRTPDGHGCIELVRFQSPPFAGDAAPEPQHKPGLRHVAFLVDDLDAVLARLRDHGAELVGTVERYRDMYRLCYVRGPAGIIVELAESIG